MDTRLTDKSDLIRVGDNVRHKSLDGWLIVTQITPDGIAWCAVQDGERVGWLAVHFVRDLVKIGLRTRFRFSGLSIV